MEVALVADAFPPLRSSAAVQLRDLALEFVRQGHQITIIIPSSEITKRYVHEKINGVDILRIKSLKTKGVNYFRRTLAEFLMPYILLNGLRSTKFANTRWDGVVWYSPTIFHGPLIKVLKKKSSCRSYLIVRDIFPEWAVDMGLMTRGIAYAFFKAIANYQYSVADVIGVQSEGNSIYFQNWEKSPNRRIEVLHNWLSDAPEADCRIAINQTILAGRRIFVYAGNMGSAQNLDILLDLAEKIKFRTDFGFLFVGRGSATERLHSRAKRKKLDNVLFFDEIEPSEIPGLYSQCDVGLVCLDPRHKSHNIPGKFLSYMRAGLPVLASINNDTDLIKMISTNQVGLSCTDSSVDSLVIKATELIEAIDLDPNFEKRCQRLASKLFSTEVAVQKIVTGLTSLK